MVFCGHTLAAPPEYIAHQQPVSASVDEETSPMEYAFTEELPPPGFLPNLKRRLEQAPSFWRDSRLYLRPRSYYFDRQRENTDDSVAAAYGGWLGFQSGAWHKRVSANATLFTTQKAYGPDDKDGTLLLGEGQEGFWVLGEANLSIELTKDLSAKLYRQSFNLPYVNRNDGRMVPNTFEAYTLTKRPGDRWAFLASHVVQMKQRHQRSVQQAVIAKQQDESERYDNGRQHKGHRGNGFKQRFAGEIVFRHDVGPRHPQDKREERAQTGLFDGKENHPLM
jgi:hypothetical protein